MSYTITKLSDSLIYVRAIGESNEADDAGYLATIKDYLDNAPSTLYFLIDFRKGITSNIGTIRKLAELSKHKNFGQSAAFADSHFKGVYADIFSKLASNQQVDLPTNPEVAKAFLESLQAGITRNIDWVAVLAD